MKNNQQLKQAEQLQREGKIEEALHIYEEIVAENSTDGEMIHNISVLYARLKQYQKALTFVNKAIKLDTHIAFFHNTKGNILLKLNEFQNAIHEYKKAIEINPQYANAYNNLGNIYYRTEQWLDAEKCYEQAIAFNPTYSDAYFNYALLLIKRERFTEAQEKLQQTLKYQPQHAPALGQLAEIYLLQNNIESAIEFLKKRLALQPQHIETLYKLGQSYIKAGQYEDAIQTLKKVQEFDATHIDCNYDLATASLKMGNYENALAYYLRQLEIRPTAETYYNIGVLLMYQERNQEATQYFKEALKVDPDYLPTHLNLGAIYLKANHVKEAIPHYKTALKLKPNDAEIQHILNALTQEQTPDHAPVDYLQHLFDQYAHFYDQHLTKHLQYHVPELLWHAITEETGNDHQLIWNTLDLGCGTGLCGEYFRKVSKRLIGIDLSKEMIEVARNKHIYDELRVADIQNALDDYSTMNLILAADVFTYIGDLSTLFKKAYEVLTDEGIFAFSVEKTNLEPYLLQQSIRYAHSEHYLKTLIEKNHFQVLRFDQVTLRKQRNQPLEGFLVVLKKS